jgi:hypothetical protein
MFFIVITIVSLNLYPLRCDEAARLPECLIFQLSERFSQSESSYVLVKEGQIASFL